MATDWNQWLRQTGIGEGNSTVSSYAQANGLSYESAAATLYAQGKVGNKGQEIPGEMQTRLGELSLEGGNSGTSSSPFGFNFDVEYKAAFDKLSPYYQKVLDRAGGDLALAKKIIKSDYDLGMRETKGEYEQARQEYALQFPQERRQLESAITEQNLLFPSESEQLATSLNRRGLAGEVRGTYGDYRAGGLAGKELGKLGESQEARRSTLQRIPELEESQKIRQEAIARALEEREARLTSAKSLGEEKETRGFETQKLTTGREHEREALGLAESKFGREQAMWSAEMQKKSADESSRLSGISKQLMEKQLANM